MANPTIVLLLIYVVLSPSGSLAPSPSYPSSIYPSGRRIDKENPNPTMDRTLLPNMPSPKCNDDDDFCVNVSNYPSDAIRRVLRANNSFGNFFKRKPPPLDPAPLVPVEGRGGGDGRGGGGYEDDPFEERVCDVLEQVIQPKVATNKKKEKKYIVNDGDEYKQFVKIEKCRNVNNECTKISGTLPKSYSSRCVQKYSSSLMVAFDENYIDTFTDDFYFPTACVCFIKSPFRS